jgi:hypothetical protein
MIPIAAGESFHCGSEIAQHRLIEPGEWERLIEGKIKQLTYYRVCGPYFDPFQAQCYVDPGTLIRAGGAMYSLRHVGFVTINSIGEVIDAS